MVRNKLTICKNYHVQPSEVDILPFFEYEWMLGGINDDIEREQEEQKKQEQNQSSMPSMPNFNMPDLNNYSVPD